MKTHRRKGPGSTIADVLVAAVHRGQEWGDVLLALALALDRGGGVCGEDAHHRGVPAVARGEQPRAENLGLCTVVPGRQPCSRMSSIGAGVV